MLEKLPELLQALSRTTSTIRELVSGKLGKNERAADSLKFSGLTYDQFTALTQGMTGEVPFIGKDNVSMAFAPASLVTTVRIAKTDAEIATMKSAEQLFIDVFNKWKRISHGTNGLFPSAPTELTTWVYNAGTDKISTPLNSGSMLGLVSPYTFDEYTFDVVVSSDNNDDDSIGLILAYKSVGGIEHTLTAQFTPGGLNWDGFNAGTVTPRVNIVVNFGQGAPRGLKLVATLPVGTIPRQTFKGADVAGGVRIKAVRSPNGTMTVEVFKPDGTEFPGGPVKWTGDIPDLFKSKCAIGYYTYSQPNSTYANITVPQPKTDIIDFRNMDVHRWNNTNGSWSIVGKADVILPKGRFYKNTEGTLETLFMTLDGEFLPVASPPADTSSTYAPMVVNEYVTIPADTIKQYDLQTLMGASYVNYDPKSSEIEVRVKDTFAGSPMLGVYANAEALVTYGVKDSRYIVVSNQSGISIEAYVKVLVHPKTV